MILKTSHTYIYEEKYRGGIFLFPFPLKISRSGPAEDNIYPRSLKLFAFGAAWYPISKKSSLSDFTSCPVFQSFQTFFPFKINTLIHKCIQQENDFHQKKPQQQLSNKSFSLSLPTIYLNPQGDWRKLKKCLPSHYLCWSLLADQLPCSEGSLGLPPTLSVQ